MSIQVTFVCLGNICRSPMAEAVMTRLVQEAGLSDQIAVDSCATGAWHVGEKPPQATLKVLKAHGIDYRQRARQLEQTDLEEADYLIAMDRSNLASIRQMGSTQAEVRLLLDYAPEAGRDEVPDPYYSGRYEETYQLVEAGCRGLLAELRERHKLPATP